MTLEIDMGADLAAGCRRAGSWALPWKLQASKMEGRHAMGRFGRAIDVPYEVGNALKRFRISRPWMLEGLPYVEHVRGLAEGPPVDAFLLKVASPTGARGYLEVDFVSHLGGGNNWRIVTKKPWSAVIPD